MKTFTPAMATALNELVAAIDLNGNQVKDWTDTVCAARDALPEGTVAALEQLGSASADALTLANGCTSMLDLAINSVERGFIDESLLHLGMLSTKLETLKGMLHQDGKGI